MTAASTVLDLPPAPPHLANDPVLRRIKENLNDLFGSRLAGVVLYGSRSRGDSRPDSDIDLLVLLKGRIDWAKERWRLAELAADIGLDTDEAPSFLLDTDDALDRRTIFMHNVREDGVVL
jgi:predicted nucleotidyltransferase